MLLIEPSNPAFVHASFTALTFPSGWSLRNSLMNEDLPWSRALTFGFRPRFLPVGTGFSTAGRGCLHLSVGPQVPGQPGFRPHLVDQCLADGAVDVPASVHASLTALKVAWGFLPRTCLMKSLLPGALVTVAMRVSLSWVGRIVPACLELVILK